MDLEDIFEELIIGSPRFAAAVETHGGFDISREEITRIAERATTAEEFESIWQNEAWWCTDDN